MGKMYVRHIKEVLIKYGPLAMSEIVQALHNELTGDGLRPKVRRRKYVPLDRQVSNLVAHTAEFHKVGKRGRKTIWGVRGVHEVEEE
jgi:hypothetical protein